MDRLMKLRGSVVLLHVLCDFLFKVVILSSSCFGLWPSLLGFEYRRQFAVSWRALGLGELLLMGETPLDDGLADQCQ